VNAYVNDGNDVEVHLPGKGPSSRADRTLFGTQIDRTPTAPLPTTTTPGDTYLSNSKLPWALHVPVEWNYPYEKLDFTIAYPDVMTWAQTGGKSNTNWFSTPANGGAFTFKANAINK
jgi:LruC domain-containing protein